MFQVRGFAAHQHIQAAVGADQQQGQFPGLAVRGNAAAVESSAVAAHDTAEIVLRQAQGLAGVEEGLGQGGTWVEGWLGLGLHWVRVIVSYIQFIVAICAICHSVAPWDRGHPVGKGGVGIPIG